MAAAAAAEIGARPAGRVERVLHILTKEAKVEEDLANWIMTNPKGPEIDSVAEFALYLGQ